MSCGHFGVVLITVISCLYSLGFGQDCDFEQSCSWEIKSGFIIADYQTLSITNPLVSKNPEIHQWKGKFIICSHREGLGCQLESLSRVPGSNVENVCLSANVFIGNENDSYEAHGHVEISIRSQDYGQKDGLKESLSQLPLASWEPVTAKFYGPVGRHKLLINVLLADNQTFVAVDDIKVDNCSKNSCNGLDDFVCEQKDKCVKWDKVCNIDQDCPNGPDEDKALCGLMPPGSMCSFEDGLCGWQNSLAGSYTSEWVLHEGASPTDDTGPSTDHTLSTIYGKYLYIETNSGSMPDYAILHSMALPGRKSYNPHCKLRFFYHIYGATVGKLEVLTEELCSKRRRKRSLWTEHQEQGDAWLYAEIPIPTISNWYKVLIEGHFGLSFHGDIAIDDVSISPECYGMQHNKTHFLVDSVPNNTLPLSEFKSRSQRAYHCKTPAPTRTSDADNNTAMNLSATGPVTSIVEVHTQQQNQSYNISIGYIIIITVAGVLLVFGSGLLCLVLMPPQTNRRRWGRGKSMPVEEVFQPSLSPQERAEDSRTIGVIKRRNQIRQTRRLEMVSNNSDEHCTNIPVQASSFDMQLRCAVTELNPNYDFITAKYPEQQLREIPRQSLTLTRLLGQGAFGEVYEGVLKNLCANVMELPVAVKTLPALSSEQAETDFFMEAVIISKFMHKNVVKCLGVCFEEHPRYIVLELLQGGDLRSFLRDSRPKQTQSCQVTMEDLVKLALDIANGCRHLEEKHFVHRDIAARNCLLTSRDPGRIAKIADFGMSRDIYSADYYRKDGKAMLPIKWMPPEAFLDGVFTSKTDVWSFGILLWEIFTLGYMPYPGQTNSDVMHFVASGGRLDPPQNCPARLNKIMLMCWNSVADIRPAFSEIIDHLDMCLQDPEVISCDLSVCHYPLAECLKDASVLVKSIPTDTSLEGESTTIPSEETTADYNGHVASQSREPLLPSPDESC